MIKKYEGRAVIYRDGEWSGLYLDGVIVRFGDHYLVDEYIATALGIDTVNDPAWLLPDGRTPRRNEADIEAAIVQRETTREQIKKLRDEADRLESMLKDRS